MDYDLPAALFAELARAVKPEPTDDPFGFWAALAPLRTTTESENS